jgi:hypothetical protein
MVVVEAEAGMGKSTLLLAWASRTAGESWWYLVAAMSWVAVLSGRTLNVTPSCYLRCREGARLHRVRTDVSTVEPASSLPSVSRSRSLPLWQ